MSLALRKLIFGLLASFCGNFWHAKHLTKMLTLRLSCGESAIILCTCHFRRLVPKYVMAHIKSDFLLTVPLFCLIPGLQAADQAVLECKTKESSLIQNYLASSGNCCEWSSGHSTRSICPNAKQLEGRITWPVGEGKDSSISFKSRGRGNSEA